MGITSDEVMAELARLSAEGSSDEGLTVPEMSERLGRQERDVRVLLKRALAAGRLQRGWRTQEALDGRMYQAPVYIVTQKPISASGPTSSPKGAGSSRD